MRNVGFLVCLVFSLLLSACGPNGENRSYFPPQPPIITAHFTSGSLTTVVGPTTIGATGGVITAPAGSSLDGLTVSIPAGALSSNKTVTLSANAGTLTVADGTPGKTFALDFGGPIDFDQPVSITIPYQGNTIPVPYYVDSSGTLHLVQISKLDKINHKATFDTFHASTFTWVLATLGLNDAYSTAFAVGADGFQIDNVGSSFNRTGECFGMTSFSLWYFETIKSAEGNFYPRLRRKVLAGAAVLHHAGIDPAFKTRLYELLDGFLQRPDERAAFDLPQKAGK